MRQRFTNFTSVRPLVALLVAFLPATAGAVQTADCWYSIYLQNARIGYSHTTTEETDSGTVTSDRTVMLFSMLGRTDSVDTWLRALSGRDMELRSFTFSLSGRDTRFGVNGRAAGDSLFLDVNMAGELHRDTLVCDEPPQVPCTLGLLFTGEKLAAGYAFHAVVYDPSALSAEPLDVRVVGREKIEWGGVRVEVWRLVQELAGARVDSWLDDQGRLLEEKSGQGYRMVLVDRDSALDGDWGRERPDIQQLIAITPDRDIPTPRQLVRLEISLNGVDLDSLDLDGGAQSFRDGRLVIRALQPGDSTAGAVTPKEAREYLLPSHFIQSDHPRLRAILSEACDTLAPPAERIRSINAWLQRNITASPTFSLPNTLEVLESHKGDCNEFAVLFCSLARAAGIPTRIAMGLIYLDNAFYYHAWCECDLEGRWVSVDPIFGQFPSDAAHVRLIAGGMDRQMEILPLIGSLGIKILDFEAGKP